MADRDRVADGPAVVCIVGKTDAGKTTLIEALVPALGARGLRVATIKHDVHGFELDHAGKDSYRHKHAGALATVISSPHQIGLVRDVTRDHTVAEVIAAYLPDVDIVLTEGYRREGWPKVEVHRRAIARPLITDVADGLIAVVSDEPLEVEVPAFDLSAVEALAAFLAERLET